MATALDCAVLSEDVYNREHNNLAYGQGWTRLDSQNWQEGFAAGVYEKNGELVVAFRGTDDMLDAVADARMVPNASAQQIASVTPAVLAEYGLSDRIELQLGAVLLSQLLTSDSATDAINQHANRVPPAQTSRARDYLNRQNPAPVCLTGHSLGGALAKTLSLQQNIPCVAFNSPFMGSMEGVRPTSSGTLLSINAKSDPLSFATRQVGNLSHGQSISVQTPPYNESPPRVPTVEEYQRPVSCPRASGSWWTSEQGIYAATVGPLCEAVMDAIEPIGRAVTAPQRNIAYWFDQRSDYVRALLNYLANVSIHYHSMTNLREKMQRMSQFNTEI